MSASDELPRGVRLERFVPASEPVTSTYRGEASRPGEAVILCATPSPPAVFGAIVVLVPCVLVGPLALLFSLLEQRALLIAVPAFAIGGVAWLLLRAELRLHLRLELGARVRIGALDVAREEIGELHIVEHPEPGDPNAFAIFVELKDGSRVRAAHRLRIDQAQYVVRLGRAALGLDGASPPRVRVERDDPRAPADAPRRGARAKREAR